MYIINTIIDKKHYIVKNLDTGHDIKISRTGNSLEKVIKLVGQKNIKEII